jgi:hypothetical protein
VHTIECRFERGSTPNYVDYPSSNEKENGPEDWLSQESEDNIGEVL